MNPVEASPASSPALEAYRSRLIEAIGGLDMQAVTDFVSILLAVRDRGGTVFIAGNGGSTSTASHYVVDWMLGTGIVNPPLPVIALADNLSGVTATGNDIDFDSIFSRPLSTLGKKGDLLVVVSASGNSPNLLRAVNQARSSGISIAAITGFDGGALKKIADVAIHVPTVIGDYGVAEDIHLMVGHMVKEALIEAVRNE
jgi:D-sedoheptulose 7-phosphate isomerase